MTPADTWTDAPGWREFFDLLTDAVVVFDARGRVVLANTAALRVLPCEAGMSLDQLQGALGAAAIGWLKRASVGLTRTSAPPPVRLADGRAVGIAWRRLDPRHGALHLSLAPPAPALPAGAAAPASAPMNAPVLSAAGLRETLGIFWEAPFPAVLQDAQFRIVDANRAFLEFTGYPREQLVGRDARELQPEADWPAIATRRERAQPSFGWTAGLPVTEGRLLDSSGRERRYRVTRRALRGDQGETLHLAVLQDATAEQVAREHADRSLREIDDWFDLSPVGMVLFDERGLLLRTNPAFYALVGIVPATLADAPAGLRELLSIDAPGGGASATATAGDAGPARLHREGWVTAPGTPPRPLRASVRGYQTAGGQRRYMAVVQDRSIEEERDLAQSQIGALMDAAGVGLATFQESSGWVRQRRAPSSAAAPSAHLQAIGRDIVMPESVPEFERLQLALRRAERAEVRYAIRHPELGQRWLLTRVEPATLASGKRTTSVVTLDVTEQHQSQQRSEQLLRELSTILESTTAGIAYLRGDLLVRCNRRFEAMLGRRPGSMSGATARQLFSGQPGTEHIDAEVRQALGVGQVFETEFEIVAPGRRRGHRWYSLSVRRVGPVTAVIEAIAVLADVTRLKTQQRELETLARDRELMFSLSGVGIAFLRDGHIQRANAALAQLAGYHVDELSRLPLSALFVDAAEFERLWPLQERDLRQHGHWAGERQLRLRDGRRLWVQVSKRLVTEGDPAGGIIASYVDIDARQRAERAVALQAERTRAILDSVLVGIVTVGPRGIEWMNRSARRMFGGDLADFMNQPIGTVATPDPDHPFLRTDYLTSLVEGEAETFECRVKARDGREFWIVGNVVSTGRESTGRQLTYALLDIERRRDAEARMSQAQAQLQRIIEAAPLAITLRDARTLKVLQVNEVAAADANTRPAALIGCTPEQIFEPALAAERRHDMEQALASTDVTKREYRMEVDGEPRIWDARYLPLSERPGTPPDQLLLVATDVTEQRAAQEARFEAALEQRDMLVKEVHHRIKNNLQGVAGLLQQIGQRKPEVASAMAEVVSQVQAIAQVYGLQVGASGPLQLVSVTRAITESVQRTFGRTIRFDVVGAAAHEWLLPEAESIPIALTLNELLTNAVKHSAVKHSAAAPDTEVLCTLECGDAGVEVRVSNRASLPDGFSLARIPSGVSGLGLVRALLPRRSASLDLAQQGDHVVATVTLRPPGVVRHASGSEAG